MQRLAINCAAVFMLAGALLFAPPFNGSDRASYALDQRPEESILFIGNYRTSDNDMPGMLRRLADAAGYERKLRIEVHAPPNASMSDHSLDPRVHALIAKGWDHVVLQAQSTEQIDKPNWGKWWLPATDLIREIQQTDAKPWMFVTWRYTDQCSAEQKWDAPANDAMHTAIQQQHAQLQRTTKVDLVNVGVVWDMLARRDMDFTLYSGCSRASIYGSYLSALMFYNRLLGGNVAEVTDHPGGIKTEQAKVLRAAVVRFVDSANAPKEDRIGKGAVLCMWSIYVSAQQGIELCGLEAQQSDAEIGRSIDRIEQFTLENTSTGVSAGDLRDYKADAYKATQDLIERGMGDALCRDIQKFRERLASGAKEQTDDLLSVAREPLWNPCI